MDELVGHDIIYGARMVNVNNHHNNHPCTLRSWRVTLLSQFLAGFETLGFLFFCFIFIIPFRIVRRY